MKNKKKSIEKIWSILTERQKKKLIFLMLPISISALLNILGIALIMPFIEIVSNPEIIKSNHKIGFLYQKLGFDQPISFVIFAGVVCFTLLVASNISSVITTWRSARVVSEALADLTDEIYCSYVEKPYDYHLKNNSSSLLNNIFVLIPNICQKYILPAVSMVSSLVSVTAIITLVIIVNPMIAGIMVFVFSLFYTILFKKLKGRISENSADLVECNRMLLKHASETFGAIKDIKVRRNEQEFKNYFKPILARNAINLAFNQAVSIAPKYLVELVAFGGIILAMIVMLINDGVISSVVPVLAMYVYAGYRLLPALQQIFMSLSLMRSVTCDIDSIYNGFDVARKEKHNKTRLRTTHLSYSKVFSLEDVYYNYPESTVSALTNINLEIKRNQTIGIIGKTGAGKTTLIDIILGLLQPNNGRLLVDGVELNEPELLSSWQGMLGYVPQAIFLADSTIKDNIIFSSNQECTDDSWVRESAKAANISDFIESLPDGYDTIVGERGVRLSGGQVQRIGIARALYRKPEILILDEATSSLDSKTESEVMASIYKMRKEVTIIIVAHRLTTLKACDKIYKLENGQIQVVNSENLF